MMTPSLQTKDQQEVWKVVQEVNEAWVKGHPENLENFFREDMVIVPPDFQQRAVGRESCVASYKDFCRQATVQDFMEKDPGIDVFGNTAVVTYSFEIRYEMKGGTFHEAGRDVFVLLREGGNWRAVWRTMIPLPQESRQ